MYAACLESVEMGRGEYVVSPFKVAFTVLCVVREIEINGDCDPDEPDNGDSGWAQYSSMDSDQWKISVIWIFCKIWWTRYRG